MRLKKILSLLLAMTILFSCIGITAMAEDVAPIVVTFTDGHTMEFDSLSEAMRNVYSGGAIEKITVYEDITEEMNYLEGNIVSGNPDGVTITNTIENAWIHCNGSNFTIGEGMTYKAEGKGSGLFVYGDNCVINGTVIVDTYYQRYADTKLTINEPGSLTVKTETFILRYTDKDPNAGIYINGDNNDATVGLNLAVAYFYQGMINAKDANIKVGTYWQRNTVDENQGSANLVLDNTKMFVTVNEHNFEATGNSTVTLTNNSKLTIAGGHQFGENAVVTADATSSIADKIGNIEVVSPVTYVAQVGGTKYETLEEAFAAAKNGDEILLLADVEGDITIPADVIFNGNGFAVSGGIIADGNITFAGITKAKDFDVSYIGTTINIGSGATLELTGTDRMVIGHGCTFNIEGNVTDAKTANAADLTPSLIIPGASFTGDSVDFNVTNAYIKATAYCSSSKTASGTFDFDINNSVWEQTNKLAFEAQSTNATVNFDLKDSVLTTTSHLVFGVDKGEIVIDNSNVNVGTSRQLENRSTMTIKNGSVVYASVQVSSNANNPGTLIVDNATYIATGEFSGVNLGTGKLILKNGATATVPKFGNATVEIGAGCTLNTNYKTDGEFTITAESGYEVKFDNGVYTTVKGPVAKIGDKYYKSFESAVADIKQDGSNTTIEILTDIETSESIKFKYGTGDVIFTADHPVTVKQTSLKTDWDMVDDKDTKFVIDENVTFEIYDNTSGMYLYYGPSIEIKGSVIGGQNWGTLYLYKGDHKVTETGKIGVGRIQTANNTLEVKGEIDTNYLLVENATFVSDGAKIDAGVIYDNNNGVQRRGASKFVIKNSSEVTTNKLTLSYADSELAIDASSSLAATEIVGAGKIIIDATGMTAGDVSTISGNASGFTGTIEVINGDHLVAEIDETGNIILVSYVAQIGETKYTSLQTALDAAAAGTGNITVEILADIDLTDVDWNPVTVSGPGYPVVTVNGNGKTITGLNDMLFAGTWAGKSGLIINNLTIADSTIVNDENDTNGDVGVGAFIGFPQASSTITLKNCHLVDSRVEGGHWTGGLIGYAAGYAGNDGPVFMNLTITGCSVTGSTVTGKGSAGGVIGHGSGNGWTKVVIEDTTVSNNTITSTGSSTNKAGALMGTIGAAGQSTTVNGVTKTGGASVSATVSGNIVKSNGTPITTIYGRQGTNTGMLYVTGGNYDNYPIEENVEYAQPKEGYEIVQNDDNTYGVVEKEAVKLFKFDGTTVTLGNSLAINFYVKLADLDGEDYYAEIVLENGEKVTIPYENWSKRNENGVDAYRLVTYDGLAAKQMTDKFSVTIYNGKGIQVSETKIDSMRDYAERGFVSFANNSKLMTALIDMLNYGAAAQVKFNYKTETLANAGCEQYQTYASVDRELTDERKVLVGENVFDGTTLSLENNIVLNAYFKNLTADMNATIEYTTHLGTKKTIDISGDKFIKDTGSAGLHIIKVDTLAVADADQFVTITVYDANDDIHCQVIDSVSSYLCRAMNIWDDDIYKMTARFTYSAREALKSN